MVCLKDYQRLVEDIAYLEYKLNRMNAELKRQRDWGKDILSNDPDGEEIEKILGQLKKELTFKKEQMEKLVHLIDKFKNVEHKILKMKYIDGMTLESIGGKLKYSPSYIKQKHAEIMRRIKFVERLKAGG
ncbi:sigma-70 family RNA polymerase sigma factor [Bacillus sp. AY1-10]|uniref:sigma factor-like helix-turn-helix DNA-binding protein n=1 Tax=Bacillus sp. AY1-10 TaxID=2217823 RepID=UPI0011EE6B3E|nr:sigma factor-like helix-turn-helix DNA-binding protein [Bacillus sp. AY1-10]KAA0744032.1 sigma-70 family RNA polymerase sigma factor [Bacillus sp. AY1-10]